MGEIDQILERMINKLDEKIDVGFERIDRQLKSQSKYYATKTQVRYIIGMIIALFFLVLSLHGLGNVVKEAIKWFL